MLLYNKYTFFKGKLQAFFLPSKLRPVPDTHVPPLSSGIGTRYRLNFSENFTQRRGGAEDAESDSLFADFSQSSSYAKK